MDSVKPHPESRLLVEHFKEIPFGTRISHEDIEILISMKRGTPYFGVITKWRRDILRDHHKHIRNVRGFGYEVTMPDDYLDEGRRDFRLSVRRSKRGHLTIQVAPLDSMTPQKAAQTVMAQARTGQLMQIIQRAMVALRPASLKRESLLQHDRPALKKNNQED